MQIPFFGGAKIGDKAPELVGITSWINSKSLTIEDLKGKVVIVDFWAFSCINCIRTLPYMKAWHETYSSYGLVIIGVNTPEFAFEKDPEKVEVAVKKFEISYPVAVDSNMKTWNAYESNCWPNKFLIDANGIICFNQKGEGHYKEFEGHIRELLQEKIQREKQKTLLENFSNPKNVVPVNPFLVWTPEIYLGYEFSRQELGNVEGFNPEEIVHYKLPKVIPSGKPCLQGEWKNNRDNMELISKEGKIVLKYTARAVNIVAGADKEVELEVLKDGKSLTEKDKGWDVKIIKGDPECFVRDYRMYSLIFDQDAGSHTIEIIVRDDTFK